MTLYKTGADGVGRVSFIMFDRRLLMLTLLDASVAERRGEFLLMTSSDRREAVILTVGGRDARQRAAVRR